MGEVHILLNIAGGDRVGPEVHRTLGPSRSASRIVMLNGHGREWRARSSGGAFSVKWVPRGRVRYETEGAAHPLGPANLLLMNSGQPYDMAFEGVGETFCIFYSDDLVREAWAGADPFDLDGRAPPGEFPNLAFRPGDTLAQGIAGLRADVGEAGDWPAEVEARLLAVLGEAVAVARRHRGEAARVPATKAVTRRHLLARLEIARTLIAEGEGTSLDVLARASGLSKFHLVRLFGVVFGCTPMKYAERLRLDRAAEALLGPRRLVEEIAFEAGYDSLGAFGRAFRRRFGVAPSAFRARK